MSGAPLCPVHGKPMRLSERKNARWFCPVRLDDGSWCPETMRDERAPAPTPAPGMSQDSLLDVLNALESTQREMASQVQSNTATLERVQAVLVNLDERVAHIRSHLAQEGMPPTFEESEGLEPDAGERPPWLETSPNGENGGPS